MRVCWKAAASHSFFYVILTYCVLHGNGCRLMNAYAHGLLNSHSIIDHNADTYVNDGYVNAHAHVRVLDDCVHVSGCTPTYVRDRVSLTFRDCGCTRVHADSFPPQLPHGYVHDANASTHGVPLHAHHYAALA